MTLADAETDFLVIGGGFYGCCLALLLRSISDRVVLVEAEDELMTRASRVNQARVHTGFHYPRSFVTAYKSLALHQRFAQDFPDAVRSDFEMLYAIGRHRSKVPARRFHRMFADMGAPIREADPADAALFDPAFVEAVFRCREYAFDYSILRQGLKARLEAAAVDVRLGATAEIVREEAEVCSVALSPGGAVRARYVFNVTYSRINALLEAAELEPAPLKHELTEVALVEPPRALEGLGVTVMDGPFFSIMPFPAEGLYSLTHVRYTPHLSWADRPGAASAHALASGAPVESRWRQMVLDARRYLPAIDEVRWRKSLYEVKTVLLKNERDDGRPILFQRKPANSRVISIMGGKIDNFYDLFDLLPTAEPEWAGLHDGHVRGVA